MRIVFTWYVRLRSTWLRESSHSSSRSSPVFTPSSRRNQLVRCPATAIFPASPGRALLSNLAGPKASMRVDAPSRTISSYPIRGIRNLAGWRPRAFPVVVRPEHKAVGPSFRVPPRVALHRAVGRACRECYGRGPRNRPRNHEARFRSKSR